MEQMLATYYSEKAKAFLKTVVCFDDEPADAVIDKPLTAKRAGSGFDDGGQPEQSDSTIEHQREPEEESHPLDFRAAANAFAKDGLLCSVLQPDQTGDSLVERIATLANAADVTILDWELEGRKVRGSLACRSAIKKILKLDREEGGRLRLIVIFTGTDGKRAIEDLADELKEFDAKNVENEFALTGNHWRVVVFQKPHTTKPTAELVNYPELPGKVVEEFSKLTDGLLPSAVLHGITAIRENTHRLLAIFGSELDGAFLTHRALIPEPSDAEEYLLGLLQDEIGDLIRRDGFGECVDASRCNSWVEEKNICESEPLKKARLMKYLSKSCRSKTDGFIKDFFQVKTPSPSSADIADAVLLALCSGESEKADHVSHRFSELTNFYKTGTAPSLSNLWLRLGTIVWDKESDNYLLCLQPLCDAARINKLTLFPFLILDLIPDGNKSMSQDFFIHSIDDKDVWLQALSSPKKLVTYSFSPSDRNGAAPIRAKIDESLGRFVFVTAEGEKARELFWIGDVKLGKAQRIASSLAARFHTLGIDEFEWQRLHQGSSYNP